MEWTPFKLKEPSTPGRYLVYTVDDRVEDYYWKGSESKDDWEFIGVIHWKEFEPPK